MSTKRSCVIDIESNNFTENLLDFSSFPYKFGDEAKLWCVVIRDLDTGEEWFEELEGVTKEWMEKTLEPFYYIIAHNGIKFDFPQLLLFGVLDYRIGYCYLCRPGPLDRFRVNYHPTTHHGDPFLYGAICSTVFRTSAMSDGTSLFSDELNLCSRSVLTPQYQC